MMVHFIIIGIVNNHRADRFVVSTMIAILCYLCVEIFERHVWLYIREKISRWYET